MRPAAPGLVIGRANSLNAIRLVLASLVIFRHAVVVTTGSIDSPLWIDQVLGQLPVDGFFALSGYLIASSWVRRPHPAEFLAARLSRIYPGFWVCLVVTALVVRPVTAAAAGQASVSPTTLIGQGVRYVAGNASLVMFHNDVAGSPVGVPWPHDWNGSLWTLKWEFACYLGVLALGLAGLVSRRGVLTGLFLAAIGAQVVVSTSSLGQGFAVSSASRFLLMYVTGMWLFTMGPRLRVVPWLTAACLLAAVASAAYVPHYRLIAALPLAYGLLGLGMLVRPPALRLRNDISYGTYIYGFPVEQLFAHSGTLVGLGTWWFACIAIAATLPLAAASWFCVEKPSQRLLRQLAHGPRRPALVMQTRGA